MEQTVNTFSKGLLMDTHPMVQGNDTLSNALNATFVTMNGNEVILQNDMGNRRVDGAFLPAGYEPVGIKEHGGIIYIASYNPITNKCLIGSFPSPLMNYGKEDGISSYIDEENLFNLSFTESDFGKIQFLRNFSILSPFRKKIEEDSDKKSTKDEILHGGDKFCVYFSEDTSFNEKISFFNDLFVTEPEELITNYNNTDGDKNKLYSPKNKERTKLYSPKNKKYTLSLGVMNSLNLFTDFTPTLLRWEQDEDVYKIIKFDSNTPDYIKFNSGYFIPRSFNSDDLSETISDALFIRNRLKLPANTYVYKLSGPLYIKKDLNVISNMTFNYYGSEVEGENESIEYKISLDIFYEYNCPDFLSFTGTLDGDNKYVTYESNPSDITKCFIGSNIKLVKYENGKSIDWKDSEDEQDENYWRKISDFVETSSKITYDPVTNTYKLKKHYVYNKYTIKEGEKYLLRIVPFTSYGLGIRNLSRLVLIDYDKLKINELSISDFRFKRNENENRMDFCLGFVGYMAGTGGINNIKMEILSGDGNSVIASKDISDPLNTGIIGINNFYIKFNENFKERKIYLAKISWNIDNSVTPLEASARIIDFDDNELETTPTTPTNTQEELEITSTNISTQVEYRWIVTTDLFNNFYEGDDIVMDYGNSSTYTDKFKEVLKVKPKITVIDSEDTTSSASANPINKEIGIYSSDANPKNKQINYVLIGECELNNKKIKLELDDLYPEEITATFAYNNKNSIGVSVNYTSNEVETEVKINNLDNYSKTDFGLRLYNDKTTDGFNSSNLTVTRDEDGCLNINYKGTFLIREYSKGIFGTRKVMTSVENVFRSVFEADLTEEKLFDLCGAVEIYNYLDMENFNGGIYNNASFENKNFRKLIMFDFLRGITYDFGTDNNGNERKDDPTKLNTILTNSQLYNIQPARIGIYPGLTTINPNNNEFTYEIPNFGTYNEDFIDFGGKYYLINYPNQFKGFSSKTLDEGSGPAIYDINNIQSLVLNDNVFNNYKEHFKDEQGLKFEFLNKNFIIGTTILRIITSFKNENGNFIKYKSDLRPIILWMRVGSLSNIDWAMLPLIDVNKSNNGSYIGNKINTLNEIRFGTKNDKHYGNKKIIEYLKSRIKDFYYKCNNAPEYAEFYRLNQIEHIYYFDDLLKLTPKLEIEISRNVTENLTVSLKNNGINQVFKTDINEVTKEDISDRNLTISFTTNKNKVSILEDIINNNDNTLKYALCKDEEYYVTLNGKEFEEGDENRIIINENGKFTRADVQINDLRNDENGCFPYVLPSYNVPCGIGVIQSFYNNEVPDPVTEGCKDYSVYLTFDFESYTDNNKTKLKLKSSNFPPTIPQSLLK